MGTGKEVAAGERGEVLYNTVGKTTNNGLKVCVRAPTVMMGYLNRPEATAETIDKEGWLHTGTVFPDYGKQVIFVQVISATWILMEERTLSID